MLAVSSVPAPRQHASQQASLGATEGQRLRSAAAVYMVYGALLSAPLVWLGAALWAHAAGIAWLAVCLAVQAMLAVRPVSASCCAAPPGRRASAVALHCLRGSFPRLLNRDSLVATPTGQETGKNRGRRYGRHTVAACQLQHHDTPPSTS